MRSPARAAGHRGDLLAHGGRLPGGGARGAAAWNRTRRSRWRIPNSPPPPPRVSSRRSRSPLPRRARRESALVQPACRRHGRGGAGLLVV